MSARDAALAFMQALWRADVENAECWLTDDAEWVFQLGMPYAAEAGRVWPASSAMRRIIDDLFSAFPADRPFAIDVVRIVADGDEVAIEYSATGKTRSGRDYVNHYVTCLSVRDGKVAQVRPYNDTKHMLEGLAK